MMVASERHTSALRKPIETPQFTLNLEGIAATHGPRGETLVWLISDDNFNPLQRNILLLFELAK